MVDVAYTYDESSSADRARLLLVWFGHWSDRRSTSNENIASLSAGHIDWLTE